MRTSSHTAASRRRFSVTSAIESFCCREHHRRAVEHPTPIVGSRSRIRRPTSARNRVRYFPRQLLTADDMRTEQEYLREKLRRHNRLLHRWRDLRARGCRRSGQRRGRFSMCSATHCDPGVRSRSKSPRRSILPIAASRSPRTAWRRRRCAGRRGQDPVGPNPLCRMQEPAAAHVAGRLRL